MSDNTKLRPEDLTAEERALWDTLAIRKLATGTLAANAYDRSEGAMIDLLKARRALFGSATEKVEFHIPIAFGEVDESGDIIEKGAFSNLQPATEKAVCPNCKEETGENHVSSYNRDSFTCQPVTEKAQESAFPVGNCKVCGELVAPYNKHAKYEGGYTCKPAQPEPAAQGKMPEAVYIAANTLRASGHVTLADALLKEAWHSQPVAVGMTEELGLVLDAADEVFRESTYLGRHEKAFSLGAAISNVRQQAAQVKPKVELPKVPVFEIRWASQFLRTGTNHPTALKNGYADAIDAWLAELDAHEGKS